MDETDILFQEPFGATVPVSASRPLRFPQIQSALNLVLVLVVVTANRALSSFTWFSWHSPSTRAMPGAPSVM